jgi:hypothetical protein
VADDDTPTPSYSGEDGSARDVGDVRASIDPEFLRWRAAAHARSSRIGDGWAAAGWKHWAHGQREADGAPPPKPPERWNNLLTLLAARDEKLVGRLDPRIDLEKLNLGPELMAKLSEIVTPPKLDVEGAMRLRLLELAKIDPLAPKPVTFDEDEATCRFLIIGDPGEGSFAQHAVAKAAAALDATRPTAFAYILSDIIYPTGAVEDYPDHFTNVYASYRRPIYAVPGNHDWDDGALTGFMWQFCNVQRGAEAPYSDKGLGVVRLAGTTRSTSVAGWGWHDRFTANPAPITGDRHNASLDQTAGDQPGPYFLLRAGPVTLVGIDTGYGTGIDAVQAQWLVRVSGEAGAKILLTGKPLVVNATRKPCSFLGPNEDEPYPVLSSKTRRYYATVDDVVRDPAFEYVAAIGGDVHNYQRYHSRVARSDDPSSRVELDYVVSGAGGAFLAMSHEVPIVEINRNVPEPRPKGEQVAATAGPWWGTVAVDEQSTVHYPRRGHSLRFFDALTRYLGHHARGFVGSLSLFVGAVTLWLVASVSAAATVCAPAHWRPLGTSIAAVATALAISLTIVRASRSRVAAVCGGATLLVIPWLGGPSGDLVRLAAADLAVALAFAGLAVGAQAAPPAIVTAAAAGSLSIVPALAAYGVMDAFAHRGAHMSHTAQLALGAGVALASLALAWNMKGLRGLVGAVGAAVVGGAVVLAGGAAVERGAQIGLGVVLGLIIAVLVVNAIAAWKHIGPSWVHWDAFRTTLFGTAGGSALAVWRWPGIDWASGPVILLTTLLLVAAIPAFAIRYTLRHGLVAQDACDATDEDIFALTAAGRVGRTTKQPGKRDRLALWFLSFIPRSAHIASLFESFGCFASAPTVTSCSRHYTLPLYRSFLEVLASRQENGSVTVEFTCRAVTGDPRDREPHAHLGINTPIEDHWVVTWRPENAPP